MEPIPLEFWCDETSHSQGQFMAVGGIAVRPSRIPMVNTEIERIRAALGVSTNTEIKWNQFSKGKIPVVNAYAGYFFSLLRANLIHYHVVIFERGTLDPVAYPGATIGGIVSRMYYQLMLHRCGRFYSEACDLHMRPDKSNALKQLPVLLDALNVDTALKYHCHRSPFRSLRLVDSKDHHISALNDLILGSIAYHRNERYATPGAAPHKAALAEAIRHRTSLPSYRINTPLNRPRFTVWNFASRKIRGPRP